MVGRRCNAINDPLDRFSFAQPSVGSRMDHQVGQPQESATLDLDSQSLP